MSGRGVPVQAQPELGPVNALTDRLGALAGPALAPESRYAKRVTQPRRRRYAKANRQLVYRWLIPMLELELLDASRERRNPGRRASRARFLP